MCVTITNILKVRPSNCFLLNMAKNHHYCAVFIQTLAQTIDKHQEINFLLIARNIKQMHDYVNVRGVLSKFKSNFGTSQI